MKAGKNKQLDYLLINLCEQPNKPDWNTALHHRSKHALASHSWTLLGTQEYGKFGPGVKLYFTLLKYMIGLFTILSVAVLPNLLINYNGNGLSIYGNSFGQNIMKFSLANQPSLEYQSGELSLEQNLRRIKDVKFNQIIIIVNDVLCSIIFVAFLVFWQLKTEDLVGEMIKKQALPSYHTLVVDLPENRHFMKNQVSEHFSKYGTVRQVQFVYDYGTFLLEIKYFFKLVEQFSQQRDKTKKQLLYDQIEDNYLKIKQIYKSKTEGNQNTDESPFDQIKAFIYFQDPQIAKRVHGLYKYRVNNMGLQFQEMMPKVQKCHVQPLSILWQNFHLKDNSESFRSWLFGLVVATLLLLTLCAIFILSLHSNGMMDSNSAQWQFRDQNKNWTYNDVIASNDTQMIFSFCAGLNYKNFQWKYYELCAQYFKNFEHHWAFVLTLSASVTVITLILIKIVFALAELRRFRTLPEKRRFLIMSIFLTYLISSSLLTLLIRAQMVWDQYSFSLVDFTRAVFPSIKLSSNIELYPEMNRKWYMHIGKLLFINFILTLNICPWLYVIEEWTLQKIRQFWARRAATQKYMNDRILDRQFYWQFYYAVILNSIYFCLLFSIAIPSFYFLGLVSIVSLFISSKIIFHQFTRYPQVYDHKLNSFIMKAFGVGLILHQFAALYILNVQEIFPEKEIRVFSKFGRKIIYLLMALLIFIVIINCKRIASLIRKKRDSKKQQLMMTEQINSSFGQGKQQHFRPTSIKLKKTSTYLNSYKMQDNPYYNNISYTLMVLYKAIIEHKDPTYETQPKFEQIQEQKQEEQIICGEVARALSYIGQKKRKSFQQSQTDRNLSI